MTTDPSSRADRAPGATRRPEGPTGARRGRRPGPTVRTRVLAAVLALSALGLTVAGVTSYALQRERLDTQIDSTVSRNVEEFRALADDGVNPATGTSFTTAADLLRVALQRAVPATNEGMLAMVDGDVVYTAPTTVRLRIEDDAELVAAAAAQGDATTATIRTLRTDQRTYRYVAVPVRVLGDDAQGQLVFAFDRGAEQAALTASYRTYALVALGTLVVTGVIGWLLTGRLLAPVRLLQRTARQITETDLSDRIAVTGDDDLSDLTRTVNAMLDRLEAAFASQRRLLDDVGHELRTPLTIIRGHLELMDPTDVADATATRHLAMDEVDRMHMLVDDLVVLATADRPDFVRPVATAVGHLTDEIAEKAGGLGEHRWRVTTRADVTAMLDPHRITQGMLQLAANAAKFSPTGSEVRLSSHVRDGRLLLEVSDDGPGVPPADADRIFERFARAQGGRGIEGSGLGLPIVAAIARAHGGSVRVDTARPSGATFVIDLPLVVTDAADATPDHLDEVAANLTDTLVLDLDATRAAPRPRPDQEVP